MPTTERELRTRLAFHTRQARGVLGLTLEEVAHRARMHWRHWQKIEAAEVNATLRTIARVGSALAVDPSALLAPRPRSGRR